MDVIGTAKRMASGNQGSLGDLRPAKFAVDPGPPVHTPAADGLIEKHGSEPQLGAKLFDYP